MRVVYSAILALICGFVIGCNPAGQGGSTADLTPADKAAEVGFADATEATEWLIDTKHTLRGINPERSLAITKSLLILGATEMKVGKIQRDEKDPKFESAGVLYIKLPTKPKPRQDVLDFVGGMGGIEEEDRGQPFAMINFGS